MAREQPKSERPDFRSVVDTPHDVALGSPLAADPRQQCAGAPKAPWRAPLSLRLRPPQCRAHGALWLHPLHRARESQAAKSCGGGVKCSERRPRAGEAAAAQATTTISYRFLATRRASGGATSGSDGVRAAAAVRGDLSAPRRRRFAGRRGVCGGGARCNTAGGRCGSRRRGTERAPRPRRAVVGRPPRWGPCWRGHRGDRCVNAWPERSWTWNLTVRRASQPTDSTEHMSV